MNISKVHYARRAQPMRQEQLEDVFKPE
jgi:hypothetical protein